MNDKCVHYYYNDIKIYAEEYENWKHIWRSQGTKKPT